MTSSLASSTVTLNDQEEYGVHDIGDVLSPGAVKAGAFSLLDIEGVLDPPELDAGSIHKY